MLCIKSQEEICGTKQVLPNMAEHSVVMTLAEKGGRDILRVLAKTASAVVEFVRVGAGEVAISGKVIARAVCLCEGGELSNIEYHGKLDFCHKLVGVNLPATATASAFVEDVKVLRVAGCEVTCEILMKFEENICEVVREKAIVSAEGCYSQVEKKELQSGALKIHNFVMCEEVEIADAVSAVLGWEFDVETNPPTKRKDSLLCSGVVHGYVCYLDIDGEILHKNVSFPFKEEFGVGVGEEFGASTAIASAKILCEVNEVKKSSIAVCDIGISISAWGYSSQNFEVGKNFFCTNCELKEEAVQVGTSNFAGMLSAQKRFSFSVDSFGENVLPIVLCSRLSSVARLEKGKFQGQIAVSLLCKVEGEYRSGEYAVPFDFEFQNIVEEDILCDISIADIDVRTVGSGMEIFGGVFASGLAYRNMKTEIVSSLECGEEKEKNCGGFLCYRASEGEELMDICRGINVLPETLMKQNPKLNFPTTEGQKVVLYLGGK